MTGFVDLHNHVLPGLDDGAATLEAGVALVAGMSELGFGEIHPTPHQKQGSFAPTAGARIAALETLRAATEHLNVTLAPAGGENMWDELFAERQNPPSFPCYEGGNAFLVEFAPTAVPPDVARRLFHFRTLGLLPVVAHVERYPPFHDHAQLKQVAKQAAILVNLSALGGIAGLRKRHIARKMVRAGIVHAVTTDAHGPEDLRYSASGLAWLHKKADDQVEALLIENPHEILSGTLPDLPYDD